jgi:glycerol transport system substrate-binding protein
MRPRSSRPRASRRSRSVSETITTHEYESKTLAKAFEEITGIKVKHDLIQEGDVVEKLQTSMQSGKSIYDGWISDSDLIGTHYRYGEILPLSDYMAGARQGVHQPGSGPEGLHRHELHHGARRQAVPVARPAVRQPVLVPRRLVRAQGPAGQVQGQVRLRPGRAAELDRLRGHRRLLHQRREDASTASAIYGHMDYGKKDPSLGWRFTDAWLSMAGTADKGIPNGLPVDEWGIRVAADKCTPVGASVARGGATNSPAAVYALTKYIDWMKKYAPQEATGMTFGEAGPVPAQGQIAQQIFWYTAFTADMTKAGLPVVNADGTPKWRMAPARHGPYWKDGMQNGYQDVGSWTFFKDHDANRTAAAWLYAQFVTGQDDRR